MNMAKIVSDTEKYFAKLRSVKGHIVLTVSFVLVGIVSIVWLAQQVYQANLQRIDTSKYQVVYLVNGQAYFGRLQNTSGDFLVLKSPYIAQSIENTDKEATDTDSATTQTTLLKVTDQIYGPDNSIALKSSQVAFWQNLRDDSKVSQAIKAKE